MTDTAIETTTITLEVTFTKVPEGWQLTDLSCEPVATGTTLGAVSAVLGVIADKYGEAPIRGGFFNPGVGT